MPFHVVGGITVPVARDQASEEEELIGDRDRMFNGDMREVSDGYKRRWTVSTRPLSATDSSTLRAALRGTPPIACSGDLTGSVDCFVADIRTTPLLAGESTRYVLQYTLLEA